MTAPSSSPGGPEVDVALVRRIADLARLELAESDLPALTAQFARIVDLVSAVGRIASLEDSGPLEALVEISDLREDVPGPTLDRRTVSGMAPQHDGAFVVVPKILAGDE